jgi:hypothetical protein
VVNGVVTEIRVTSAGSGYSSAPDVIISAPQVAQLTVLELAMVPRLTFYGAVGSTNEIQYANAFGDTNHWLMLTNIVLSSSPQEWYDTISPPGSQRYYQAVVLGTGPLPPTPPGFVWIAPGQFTMGSPDTEQERAAGRLPAGWVYHLPTEAEWEYACRAGTTTRFSFGDDPTYSQLRDYAWYNDMSGRPPQAVGLKLPNPWGLYDMHGNAAEWCGDWYEGYPGGSVSDPNGPISGSYRIVRGGSHDHEGQYCRSAYRHRHYTPDFQTRYMGLRAVLAAGQLSQEGGAEVLGAGKASRRMRRAAPAPDAPVRSTTPGPPPGKPTAADPPA